MRSRDNETDRSYPKKINNGFSLSNQAYNWYSTKAITKMKQLKSLRPV